MAPNTTRGPGIAHADRRQEILDAVIGIVDADGIEHVSMRRTAAAARVSLGRVQHYFPTRTDLLAAAFAQVSELQLHETNVRLERFNEPLVTPAAEVMLTAIVHALIPMSDAVRMRTRVALAFEAYALSTKTLTERVERVRRELVDAIAPLLEATAGGLEANAGSHIVVDLGECRREAHGLLATVSGLASWVVTDNLAAHQAAGLLEANMDAALSRLRGASPSASAAGERARRRRPPRTSGR